MPLLNLRGTDHELLDDVREYLRKNDNEYKGKLPSAHKANMHCIKHFLKNCKRRKIMALSTSVEVVLIMANVFSLKVKQRCDFPLVKSGKAVIHVQKIAMY